MLVFILSTALLGAYGSRMLREDLSRQLLVQQFATVSQLAAQLDDDLKNHIAALQVMVPKVDSQMMGKNSEAIDTTWKAFLSTDLAPQEKALVAEMEPALAAYRNDGLNPAKAALLAGKPEDAMAIYRT